MSSHYKLKATIEGVEVVGESLELTGNKAFKVFPVEKNNTKAPIRGSAVVSILGKNHSISLNHKVNDSPDPEPSSTKYSYIMNMYVSGTTPVAAADKENQDTAYVMASCGKTTYDSTGHSTQKIIISDAYTTQAAVRAAVGDFSSYAGGVEYNRGSVMTLITFVMYYKFAEEVGGVVVPPPVPDEDTPASHRKRIPCRPSAAVNDWIVNGSVGYIVEFKATESGAWQRRFFNAWNDFIAFWDSIYTNTTDYYDMVFYYIYQGIVQFNSSLNERVGPITITEIDNGKGVGIHGAKNLYLVPAQQEGFKDYNLASVPVDSNAYSGGFWHIDYTQLTGWKLAQHRLPVYQGTTPGDIYNGSCEYHPEFKIRTSINAGRGAPADVYAEAGLPLAPNADGFVLKYQYIGKPVVFGMYSDSPLGKEVEFIKPYYKKDDSNDPDAWLPKNGKSRSLLGTQLLCPFELNGGGDGLIFKEGLPYLGGVDMGNHYSLQLIPLRLLLSLGNEYGWSGQGVNEVDYFNNGNSAVTSADLINRAMFVEYTDPMDPTKNSYGTIMSRKWEDTWLNGDPSLGLTHLLEVMFVPVLHTDFYLENVDFPSGRGFGRLWFSPALVQDGDQTEFILRQIVISSPTITRI